MNAKTKHPLYNRWHDMVARCSNPKATHYHRYGGRGITVCESWHDFSAFCSDMEPTYRPGLTLDRIDNDGDYEAKNCRWATRAEQLHNQCRNVWIDTPWGRMVLKDASRKSGIDFGTLHRRHRLGQELFAPVQSRNPSNRRNVILVDSPWGRISLADAADKAGINRATLYGRYKAGYPLFQPGQRDPRNNGGDKRRDNVWIDTPWGRMLLMEAARKTGIKSTTLRWRLRNGRELFDHNPNKPP